MNKTVIRMKLLSLSVRLTFEESVKVIEESGFRRSFFSALFWQRKNTKRILEQMSETCADGCGPGS